MDVAPVAAWELAAALPDRPDPHDLARLREMLPDVPIGQWNAVVTQTLLRRKAEATLGSGPWWLTEAGLQQASRPAVAVRRARQLAEQRAAAAGIEVRVPSPALCTDNGAMVAALGSRLVSAGVEPTDLGFRGDSSLPVMQTHLPGHSHA